MDIYHTTDGLDGEDLLLLPIVQLVQINNGFLIIRDLGLLSTIECGYEDCFDLARYVIFCSDKNMKHAQTYNCEEHKDWLIELCTSKYVSSRNH